MDRKKLYKANNKHYLKNFSIVFIPCFREINRNNEKYVFIYKINFCFIK